MVVVVVFGGGGGAVVVVVLAGAGAVVVVVLTGARVVVVEAGGLPEVCGGEVRDPCAVEVVLAPCCADAVALPGWSALALVVPPDRDDPLCPVLADREPDPDAAREVGFEAARLAPLTVAEAKDGAASAPEDGVAVGVMPCASWGGNLGLEPPGATTTRTASRTATPARPASMPRRCEPSWRASAASSASSSRGLSNSARIRKSASGSCVSPAPGAVPSSSMSHPFLVRRPSRRFPQRRTRCAAEAYG